MKPIIIIGIVILLIALAYMGIDTSITNDILDGVGSICCGI